MHEFSLCQSIVEIILAELKKVDAPKVRLKKARLVAGALRQVVPESMTFAFELLTKNTEIEGAQLEMVTAQVKCKCRSCGWEGEIEDMIFQCRGCKAATLDILSGKELYLDSLEIEKDEH